MDETKLLLNIPKDINYKLNIHLAKLRRDGVKTTKHELVVKLLQIGLLHEKQD